MTLSAAGREALERKRISFGILLWPGAEMLDFAAPYEVFHYAGRAWTIGTASEVRIDPGTSRLVVDRLVSDTEVPDVLVVPGGQHDAPEAGAAVEYLRRVAARAKIVTSVCTGAFLLGRAGLLDGRNCTTHSSYRQALRREFPFAVVHEATLVADGADLLTAANIASGIDLSLYLLRRLYGEEIAEQAARALNYPWRRSDTLEFNSTRR